MDMIANVSYEIRNGNELHFFAQKSNAKKGFHVWKKIEDKEVLEGAYGIADLALEEMAYGAVPCGPKSLEAVLNSCHDQIATRVARHRYQNELEKLLGEQQAAKIIKTEDKLMWRGCLFNPNTDKRLD